MARDGTVAPPYHECSQDRGPFMKKTLKDITPRTSTIYPKPYDEVVKGRTKYVLGNAFDLNQFGVNLTVLAPGGMTALRHWHSAEDEFIYVLDGEVTLMTDEGDTLMRAGEFVGFKAGVPNGHCFANRSGQDVRILEVGTRNIAQDRGFYPGLDLMVKATPDGKRGFFKLSGEPYTGE